MAESLRKLIEPYFLRREKKDIFPPHTEAQQTATDQVAQTVNTSPQNNTGEKTLALTVRKNDFIVWLPITVPQHSLYCSFLQSAEVQDVSN
jgi:hypothetical protein